jgi:hypothetical protein
LHPRIRVPEFRKSLVYILGLVYPRNRVLGIAALKEYGCGNANISGK